MADVSIVVPCYNVEKELPRCLDSLLQQGIPIEIILVNDGSTDKTAQIAHAYMLKHSNIRMISKKNQGLSQARKSGLKEAMGTYVGFVDSDDWVEPQMYERLLYKLIQTGSDVAAGGLYKNYDDGSKKIEKQMLEDGTVLTTEEAFHYLHCRRDIFPYMWNKLYRKELLEGIDWPKENFVGEDYATQVQILEKADRIVTVNAPLYHYWQSRSSMSRGGFRNSHLLSYQYYQETSVRMLSAHPEMKADVYSHMAVEYMAYVIAMSRNHNYNVEMLGLIQKYVRTHLLCILRNKHVSELYKGSAVLLSIHHKLLTGMYWLIR